MDGGITFKQVSLAEETLVQSLLEQAPGYYKRSEGLDKLPKHMARKEMEGMPAKRGMTYEKIFLVVYQGQLALGVIDLHRNHPQLASAYIGLLLLGENHHAKGLGRSVFTALERYAKTLGISRLVLGVADDNDVSGFWMKMGFGFNGKTYVWKGENKDVFVKEMEKPIV